MIKIFKKTDTVFSGNGEKILKPLKCIVKEKDNGDYFADIECSLDYIDYLKQDNIVVIPLQKNEQAFRIATVKATNQKLKIRAKHIFYDTENYLIADAYVVEKSCNDALDHLNLACDDTTPFKTISDVDCVNTYRCVRKTFTEAVETVIERWGGHLVRDNWTIGVREEIGQDNGVTVRYAKNLKSITCEESWDNVATKILPVGKDGITLDDLYIYSDVQYDLPYTKTVKFKQNIDKEQFDSDEEYKDAVQKDLYEQARKYVQTSYLPDINYKLTANVEAQLGDTIEVIDERLGINVITNVIATEYDAIQRKTIKLEFGNFEKSLKGFAKNLNMTVNEQIEENNSHINEIMEVKLKKELGESESKIWAAMGNSYVIYEGNRILVVDKLPKEQAEHVLMINNGGIAFGENGIHGNFTSAWTLDGTLNMQAINVLNLTADLIKGGTLKLGSSLNQSGILEIFDNDNSLIGRLDKDGLKMLGKDGSYVVLNNEIGFAGFDSMGNKIYWVDKDEFHMKKAVVEEEITLCNKMRFIPITLTGKNGEIVNDGIALVATNL